MPTSSTDTRQIEAWLSGTQQAEESLLFQANLILQPRLVDTLQWQQKTYRLVNLYGRQQVRREIKEAEQLLFNDSAYTSFREKILRLFKR